METETLFRRAEVSAGEVANTIRLSFASELPVLRRNKDGQYWEILSHAPGDANLGFLNRKGLALQDHNEKLEIGEVVRGSAKVDTDKKCRCELNIMDEAWQTRAKTDFSTIPISVGYVHLSRKVEAAGSDGVPIHRCAWSPYEVSLLTHDAADFTVGINRSKIDLSQISDDEIKTLSIKQKQRMKILLDANSDAGGGGKTETIPAADPLKLERNRVKEITKTADELLKNHPHCRDIIEKSTREAIGGDKSIGDYQVALMRELLGAKPVKSVLMEDLTNGDENAIRSYSMVRGIQSVLRKGGKGHTPDGLEGEIHQELIKRCPDFSPEGFGVPHNARISCRAGNARERRRMARDLNVTSFAQGGALVPTEFVSNIIEILRNRLVTAKMGITTVGGLSGNVAFPRQDGAATAYALPESATLTKSTQTLSQILMAPHRVGAWNDYTRQLLLQSPIDIENFIRDDLMKQMGLKWDYLIMFGQGANDEPLGMVNTPGIGSVVFGGTATYPQAISFETALAMLNADEGNMGFATTPSVRGRWKSLAANLTGATTVISGPENAIWAPGAEAGEGEINGYRGLASNQILNNQVIFANWGEVIHGLYGGFDVIVNPYSRDTDAAVRITVNSFGDVAVRHAASICVSADAGNQ